MARLTVTELATTVEELQAQIAELSKHVEYLERRHAGANGAAKVPAPAEAAPPVQSEVPAVVEITEEELLAIAGLRGHRSVSGRTRSYTTDSPGEHERLGATGARVDPGVP